VRAKRKLIAVRTDFPMEISLAVGLRNHKNIYMKNIKSNDKIKEHDMKSVTHTPCVTHFSNVVAVVVVVVAVVVVDWSLALLVHWLNIFYKVFAVNAF